MTTPRIDLTTLPAWGDYALAIHGGAGVDPAELSDDDALYARADLELALAAGREVLGSGGQALDAVCAAVCVLENSELFNAGRGAALTSEGTAELDAAVMTGALSAGAVTTLRGARNPVLAARAVMEQTPHVLLASPGRELLESWGLDLVDDDYYVTERRLAQLASVTGFTEYKHGTVGAVARDRSGHIAAATSTGGITAQLPGRVGDTPIPGAGTFADPRTVAVSCTGQGEYFLRGSVGYDIHARLLYGGASLPDAVRDSLQELIGERGADGGVIAVTPSGEAVLGFNSPGMYRGYIIDERLHTAIAPAS